MLRYKCIKIQLHINKFVSFTEFKEWKDDDKKES